MNVITNFYRTLSNDLQKLIGNVDESKVVNIKIGNYPNVENFRAHSNILVVRSPFFRNTLSEHTTVDENNMINVRITEIDSQSFPAILQ